MFLDRWVRDCYTDKVTEKRVLPTDWSDIDTFRSPVTSTWALPKPLSPAQMTRLLDGFQPRQMEDKWFVYSDGPDEEGVVRVNFYRSWTSFKLAQMEIKLFSEGEGGGWVTGLIWESHPDKVNGQDAAGAKEMVAGVCRWVLGVELPLPVEVEAAEARGERAEEEVDGQGE